MNNETIALFLALLSKAYWEIDYYRFLEITGFVDDLYAIEKFKTFQLAVKQLNQFDPEITIRIISSVATVADCASRN
ncbi:hypothetical protein [Microseira sp. BLCC-F43]|uniref:hypothetical protein n=1 Tax=Microseira sp. BLCC-F43 TaxID=3153602 RepID=UPI0035B835B3